MNRAGAGGAAWLVSEELQTAERTRPAEINPDLDRPRLSGELGVSAETRSRRPARSAISMLDSTALVSSARHHRYTYLEYVALEEHANVRHEFFDGEIYAMAGGTPEHAAICMNVGTALNVQLRGRGCRVHSSDLLIRVLETGLATYPDVTVVCARADLDPLNRNAITNPTVLVEVLSPGTAEYDRGEKLAHYKRISSLREVVLVAHDEQLVEVWRREDGDAWTRSEARSGSIRLASIDCTLEVAEVYRDELAPR